MALFGQIILMVMFTASMLAVGWLAWRLVQRQDQSALPHESDRIADVHDPAGRDDGHS